MLCVYVYFDNKTWVLKKTTFSIKGTVAYKKAAKTSSLLRMHRVIVTHDIMAV